jgi:predicted small secreted protein
MMIDEFIAAILKHVSKDYLMTEPTALSKMKKSDLVKECKKLGIPITGSVIELKNSIKTARTLSGIKAVRGNTKKKVLKKVAPRHNHDLCIEIREDCPLCQSHGNVMTLKTVEYEIF